MTTLKTQNRPEGKSTTQLRKENLIPAVVYRKGEAAVSFALDYVTFEKLYEQAGESTLIDLKIPDGSTKRVLIHEVQLHPLRNKIIHVDFFEVDLTQKVTANVELIFAGESPAVKVGGILIKTLEEVEIECLPNDLIHSVEVDLSKLVEIGDSVHVSDLQVPANVAITNNAEDVVASVAEPKVTEEEPVAAEGGEGEGGEGEGGEGEGGDKPADEQKAA